MCMAGIVVVWSAPVHIYESGRLCTTFGRLLNRSCTRPFRSCCTWSDWPTTAKENISLMVPGQTCLGKRRRTKSETLPRQGKMCNSESSGEDENKFAGHN